MTNLIKIAMECSGFLAGFQFQLTVICIFIQPAFLKLILHYDCLYPYFWLWMSVLAPHTLSPGGFPADFVPTTGPAPCKWALSSQWANISLSSR